MIGTPYKYRGWWLWPIDGYYDVHADDAGRPSEADPDAELLSLADAKSWINDENRHARLVGMLDSI